MKVRVDKPVIEKFDRLIDKIDELPKIKGRAQLRRNVYNKRKYVMLFKTSGNVEKLLIKEAEKLYNDFVEYVDDYYRTLES
jgi:DNA phosphorothioation-dependent restriction protein DptG